MSMRAFYARMDICQCTNDLIVDALYSLTHSHAMNRIGERLKGLLHAHPNYGERGQSKLSRDTGVPQPTISRILRGGSVPELETLAALAVPFGVTCEWLLTERGPKFVAELYAPQPQGSKAAGDRALSPNARKAISLIQQASNAGLSEEAFTAITTLLHLLLAGPNPSRDGDLPHLQP